jgi:RNA polymerase sigma factor (sigma-70 family)
MLENSDARPYLGALPGEGQETDMHADRLREPLRRLRHALAPAGGAAQSDGQLLGRFLSGRDEGAFEALVRRHGPMVLGLCRRLVRHDQDAEDCFQAAFLVLAQRAGSVRKRASLASWLYGVAYRVALRCRCVAARRQARERQVEEMPQPEVSAPEPQDWRPLLDEELNALPEKYRAAVVLCDLEGKARKEAARLLGVPEGTLSSRLAQARSLLAGRLSRRGVALSAGALTVALSGGATTAAVPTRLVVSTAKVAALVAAGQSAAVGPHAALLMHEVQKGMLMAKLKVCAALASVTLLLGAGGFAYQAAGQTARPAKSAEVRPAAEMDLLRKEVELLKLQVELLQEKVRAQGAELRDLKGRAGYGAPRPVQTPPAHRFAPPAGADNAAAPAPQPRPRNLAPTTSAAPAPAGIAPVPAAPTPAPEAAPAGVAPVPVAGDVPAGALPTPAPTSLAPPTPAALPADPAVIRGLAPAAKTQPDAVSQVETAVKALREARDPEARRRATEALEKAVKKLRSQPARTGDPAQPSQP